MGNVSDATRDHRDRLLTRDRHTWPICNHPPLLAPSKKLKYSFPSEGPARLVTRRRAFSAVAIKQRWRPDSGNWGPLFIFLFIFFPSNTSDERSCREDGEEAEEGGKRRGPKYPVQVESIIGCASRSALFYARAALRRTLAARWNPTPLPPCPPTSIHLPLSHSVRPPAAFLSVCHFLTTGLGGLSPLDYSIMSSLWFAAPAGCGGETFFCLSFFSLRIVTITCSWCRPAAESDGRAPEAGRGREWGWRSSGAGWVTEQVSEGNAARVPAHPCFVLKLIPSDCFEHVMLFFLYIRILSSKVLFLSHLGTDKHFFFCFRHLCFKSHCSRSDGK